MKPVPLPARMIGMSYGSWLLLSAMPRAVHHRHVIEERAIAVGRRLQALEVVREHLHVVRVDLRHLLDLLHLAGVVRNRVMRVGHADLRVSHAAVLAPDHERNHAREIALIRQHLQVEHQLHVRFPVGGNAGRMVDEGQLLVGLRFGELNTLLDVANRRQIFGEFHAIGRGQRALEMRDLFGDRVEDALLLAHARRAHLRIGRARVAEQTLEDDSRIVLRRQRRVRALPHDRARVRTRIAGVARARCFTRFHRRARARATASSCRSRWRESGPSRCRHRARSRWSGATRW